jgi:hypothetical protein
MEEVVSHLVLVGDVQLDWLVRPGDDAGEAELLQAEQQRDSSQYEAGCHWSLVLIILASPKLTKPALALPGSQQTDPQVYFDISG